MKRIIGISAFYHDSAVALIENLPSNNMRRTSSFVISSVIIALIISLMDLGFDTILGEFYTIF